jgi:hypothetical protein
MHAYIDDPRVIILKCRKCARQWPILIPEKNPRAFLYGVACECGDDPATGDLVIAGGVGHLRTILHGPRTGGW